MSDRAAAPMTAEEWLEHWIDEQSALSAAASQHADWLGTPWYNRDLAAFAEAYHAYRAGAEHAAPTPEKCLCIEFAVHRDCPVHGWQFEERKANLADALAKNPLQPTPEKCHDACPQCGSDDRRIFQWGCAADDRHPWHDAASPSELERLKEEVVALVESNRENFARALKAESSLAALTAKDQNK